MTRARLALLPLLLAGCAHAPGRALAPTAEPAIVAAPSLPTEDCSPNGVMGAPEDPTPVRPLDPAAPRETIELLTCRFPPPPYTPPLDADGNPDANDAYWHSFATWKAYLVRAGAHPYVWETALSVGQYHEGYADARVIDVVPGPTPLLLVEHESGAMGIHGEEIYVFRLDAPPRQLAVYDGDALAAEVTSSGYVLHRCYQTAEQREHGVDCMTLPDQIESSTIAWVGGQLTTLSTTPYRQPPPKD